MSASVGVNLSLVLTGDYISQTIRLKAYNDFSLFEFAVDVTAEDNGNQTILIVIIVLSVIVVIFFGFYIFTVVKKRKKD